jgi:uncharacterized membrane protein YeaQ/YmgE (transglycosylase-associated protein family)
MAFRGSCHSPFIYAQNKSAPSNTSGTVRSISSPNDCPRCIVICELGPLLKPSSKPLKEQLMGIIWTIIIGLVAGVIAKFIMPGKNEPSGFVLTTILGIVGAVVATYLGQALGWYAPGQGAGLIGAIVGACVVLFVWGIFAKRRT